MGLREAPQLRVAGIPVMQCQALPAGNILVMDRMYTHIRDRRAVAGVLDGADGCGQLHTQCPRPSEWSSPMREPLSQCAAPQRQLPHHRGLVPGRA